MLAPEAGEEAALAERRQFLMRAEKVAGDLNEAYELIGGNASPLPELVALARRLERKSAEAPGLLEPTISALGSALDHLEDARRELETAMRASEFDPSELERTEERLFALRAAARKHHVLVDDLAALAAGFSARLSDIDLGDSELRSLAGCGRGGASGIPQSRRLAVDSPRRSVEGAGEGGQCRASGAQAAGRALHRSV